MFHDLVWSSCLALIFLLSSEKETVWMPGRFRCVYINLPAEPGADDYVVKACNSNQRLSDASSLDDTVRHVFASLHHVRMPRGLESESRSMLISAPCAEDIVGIDTATSTTTGIASGSQSPPPSEAKRRSSKWDDSGPSPLVCYALRLWPGEELKGALAEFATNRAIRAGFIVSCVGSLRDVVLRLAGAERPSADNTAVPAKISSHDGYEGGIPRPSPQHQKADPVENRKQQQQEQHMLRTGSDARFEVLSLVGTLSPDGLHLHVTIGDEDGAVRGGHLVRATVHTTAEVVIGDAPALAFSREMDPHTGFKELVISGRGARNREGI